VAEVSCLPTAAAPPCRVIERLKNTLRRQIA